MPEEPNKQVTDATNEATEVQPEINNVESINESTESAEPTDETPATPSPAPIEPINPEKMKAAQLDEEPATVPTEAPAVTADTPETSDQPVPAIGAIHGAKKSKKKWFIFGGIAAVLLLTGGSAAAYAWYQDPNKVVLDGLLSMVTAKSLTTDGTVSLTNDSYAIDMTLTSAAANDKASVSLNVAIKPKTTGSAVSSFNLTGNMVAISKDGVYLKVGNLKKLVEQYAEISAKEQFKAYQGRIPAGYTQETLQKQIVAQFAPTLEKIDNQWIKISYDELDQTKSAKKDTTKCQEKAVDNLINDRATRSEVTQAYQKNRFIKISKTLGSKNGSNGYQLQLDTAKAKTFASAVDGTKFASEMKKCDAEFNMSESFASLPDNLDVSKYSLEVWVQQWSHELTGIKLTTQPMGTANIGFNLDIATHLNTNPSVTVPSGARSIKDIFSDLYPGSTSTLTPQPSV